MGKKNLSDKIVTQARMDTSGHGKRSTSMGLIWGKGWVLADGSPAKGFYIHENLGPVVQAVPFERYRDWLREGAPSPEIFAKTNMRLFEVVLTDKIDFNALQNGSHKYDLLIYGEFATETVAYPVLKSNTRTLESTVPEGDTLNRKSINRGAGKSSADRIKRIEALRAEDVVKTEQFADASGSVVERRASFPRDDESWYGSMMMNPVRGQVTIYRDHDSSSKVMSSGSSGQLEISGTDIHYDANINNVSYGDLAENPLQSTGSAFSSVVTPIPRLIPQVKSASWVTGLYSGLLSFFNESDREQYGPSSEYNTYDHEVIDIDSFRPTSGEDE